SYATSLQGYDLSFNFEDSSPRKKGLRRNTKGNESLFPCNYSWVKNWMLENPILDFEIFCGRCKSFKFSSVEMRRYTDFYDVFCRLRWQRVVDEGGVKLPTESMIRRLNEVCGIRSGCAEMCITEILLVF
ncbi:hypothetical protein CEXT_139641, partial [Caerostris extrusa]